jgi:hypothetical protein
MSLDGNGLIGFRLDMRYLGRKWQKKNMTKAKAIKSVASPFELRSCFRQRGRACVHGFLWQIIAIW